MSQFDKNKPWPSTGNPAIQPMKVHLVDALKRAEPVTFTMNSFDLTGLLIEAVQLAKLVTTEKRDLEAIRSDYTLKSSYLEKKHAEIIMLIQQEYTERATIVNAINARAKQLIEAEQYQAGETIINRMLDIIANNSPLRQVMEMQNQRLLT